MSGFLKGCAEGPDALRREKLAAFGKRILVMGAAEDGKVVGLVLTERDYEKAPILLKSRPQFWVIGADGEHRRHCTNSKVP